MIAATATMLTHIAPERSRWERILGVRGSSDRSSVWSGRSSRSESACATLSGLPPEKRVSLTRPPSSNTSERSDTVCCSPQFVVLSSLVRTTADTLESRLELLDASGPTPRVRTSWSLSNCKSNRLTQAASSPPPSPASAKPPVTIHASHPGRRASCAADQPASDNSNKHRPAKIRMRASPKVRQGAPFRAEVVETEGMGHPPTAESCGLDKSPLSFRQSVHPVLPSPDGEPPAVERRLPSR